ncbi:MAG: sodium ion-translocating decarboxylase subunit beta, partial [Akkermansiaceae bacterium]|nr:sodium ion-translocating decarboxylase subunit beta [Akkermansiaceae bacterium]
MNTRRPSTIVLIVLVLLGLCVLFPAFAASGEAPGLEADSDGGTAAKLRNLWESTGLHGYFTDGLTGFLKLAMVGVGLLLIYLGIARKFEPLLLIPIGFGGLLANIPYGGMTEEGGFLYMIFDIGIDTGLFPLLIFMGVGAMTDFGPLLANPKTALLGAAAQLGIFSTLLGALWLSGAIDAIDFSIQDASAIAIIGGADGPPAIFLAGKLAPELLGAIAVAAYSYMALVPIIQPPIMRAFTTREERQIEMKQLRPVKKIERIVFPLMVVGICALLLPSASPLVGMLMLGNLFKECGVVERLSRTAANELINTVTILLGL